MRGLEIEAIYEKGTLRLARELPLAEGQKVQITIHPPGGVVERSYGRLQATLSPEELERIARNPESGSSASCHGEPHNLSS
jgi:predicted DNA-binding antitoxin AbrB/MazE fold protein